MMLFPQSSLTAIVYVGWKLFDRVSGFKSFGLEDIRAWNKTFRSYF